MDGLNGVNSGSGFPASETGANYAVDTSLGDASSSFIKAVGANQSSSSSSSSFEGEVRNQTSSYSEHFLRPSQPPNSVLGITGEDRHLVDRFVRHGPRPRFDRFGRKPRTNPREPKRQTALQPCLPRDAASQRQQQQQQLQQQQQQQQHNSVAQQRRVMAKLNQTGSNFMETEIPRPIVVNTMYSTTGIGGRRILSKNQNNTSAEDGHFASSSSSASGCGAARMDTSDATQSTSQSAFALHQQWTRRQPQQQQQQQQQMTGSSMILVNQRQMRKQQQQRHQLHPQRQQQQQQQLWHQQQQQQRHQIVGSGFPAQILKQIHGQNCNRNFNAESPCSCGNEKGKLRPDINSDIIPKRRAKRNLAKNFNEDECEGESMWDWHVDAKWGCQKYPEVYYCEEECPSLLEYLLCPVSDECMEEDEYYEWANNADEEVEPDLEAVISLRQGETGKHEVRNVNIVKKDEDDFTVSWQHPPGHHETYVVVVYPPLQPAGSARAHGPDCGACAEDEDCICATTPIFRKHVHGEQSRCDFPVECLEAGKSFYVEVATLNEARDESFGTSLVQIDVYQMNKA